MGLALCKDARSGTIERSDERDKKLRHARVHDHVRAWMHVCVRMCAHTGVPAFVCVG